MPIRLQANNGNIDLKVPVMGGGIEQVQADWAQNDTTAKDYIKNRICYDNSVSIFATINSSNIYATNSLTNEDLDTFSSWCTGASPVNLKINNTVYALQPGGFADGIYTLNYNDTAVILRNIRGTADYLIIRDGFPVQTAGLNFTLYVEEIKQIDKKYIPDELFTQANWNENNETSPAYIQNRPGGYVEESSVVTTLYNATPDSAGEVEITLFPLSTEVGTITIDGVATTYTCVTETINKQQIVSFGTATLAEIYSGTADAIVAASTGTVSTALIGKSYVGKHIIISIGGEVVHTIPTKFIDNNLVNKVNNAVSMATAAQKDVDKIKSDGLSYTGSRDGIAFIGVNTYGNAEISRKRSEDSAEGMDIELASAGLSLTNHGRYGKLTSIVVMSTTGTTDNPALYLNKARIAGVNEPEEDTDAATKKYVDTQLPTVPTNVSSFTNDSGYLTLSTLPKYDGGVE